MYLPAGKAGSACRSAQAGASRDGCATPRAVVRSDDRVRDGGIGFELLPSPRGAGLLLGTSTASSRSPSMRRGRRSSPRRSHATVRALRGPCRQPCERRRPPARRRRVARARGAGGHGGVGHDPARRAVVSSWRAPGAGARSRLRPAPVGRPRRIHAVPLRGSRSASRRHARRRHGRARARGAAEVRLETAHRARESHPRSRGDRSPLGDREARRISLKKKFSDGTFAVDLDPLSLLTRLRASVPPPRFPPFGDHEARHTVRYAGVLASASKLRPRILPEPPEERLVREGVEGEQRHPRRRCRYRPWAELMMRTFAVDVLCCPRCSGRLRLVALMTEPKEIGRYLRALGEPTEVPQRSPARGPP
jgi:hypothetical protein